MKHKSAELLMPPSPHELLTDPPTSVSTSASSSQQRKKPHVLPPLSDKRKSSVDWRPRGSPPPGAWRRGSADENLLGCEAAEDKPAVRVSRCPDALPGAGVGAESTATTAASGLRSTKYTPLEPIKRQPRPV